MKLKFAFKNAAAAAGLAAVAMSAHAVSIAFDCTTNNSGSCSTIAAQMSLEVVDLGGGQATFTFANNGPLGSSINDIYWRTSGLTGVSITDSGAGVAFSWGASPNNPGGGITWLAALASDSDAPVGPNGIDPGQWVRFTVGYTGGFDTLVNGLTDGIAIHIQRIGPNDESEWAVSTPIPEPQTYALMLAGLGAVGFIARRRRPR